ncbi:MAG: hypothetical protein AAGF12_31915 [Myxococcota bacterium]
MFDTRLGPKTSGLRWLVFALGALSLVGCLQESDPTSSGTEIRDVRPNTGAPCSARHFTVAMTGNQFDDDPTLVRFEPDLRRCQGATIDDMDWPNIARVAGLSDGSEVIGREGHVARILGTRIQWKAEHRGSTLDMAEVVSGGQTLVAVLVGGFNSSFGDRIELRSAEDGDLVKTFDEGVRSDTMTIASSPNPSHLYLSDGNDRVYEVLVDLNAESLGGVGLLDVPLVGFRSLNYIEAESATIAGLSSNGIFHWSTSTNAFLGPRQCRWSRFVSDVIPEQCDDFEGLAYDSDFSGNRWFTSCRTDEGRALVRIGLEDDCEVILAPIENSRVVDMTWTG